MLVGLCGMDGKEGFEVLTEQGGRRGGEGMYGIGLHIQSFTMYYLEVMIPLALDT